ncbi:MAG: HAD-IA family hydrolase [Lentisphaerae bacterium]|nr:HAD-IA family hydrolase [Lentisphaerota bacterium]
MAQAGADMAVISNKLHEPTLALLEHFNLAPLFSMALGGGQVKPKPHPEGLHRVMQALDYGPDTTWMIGDSANDLGTARAAGAHGVYLTYGYTPAAPEIPELTFDDFPALTEYFLTHHLN